MVLAFLDARGDVGSRRRPEDQIHGELQRLRGRVGRDLRDDHLDPADTLESAP